MLLLVLVLVLVPTRARAAERLVIISPHWEGLRIEIGHAFQQWYQAQTGQAIEVDWRDLGGTTDDLKFVKSEFEQRPAGIGIDLFFGGGMDPFLELGKRGLLEPWRAPATLLAGIPAAVGGVPIYDPAGNWYGTALSSFGILFNKRVLERRGWPVVETWRDLAERAPLGSIASGDPRNSGTMHMMYELILQRYGWDDGWAVLINLAGRIRAFDRGAATSAKEVAVGNAGYALAIDFYALTQIAHVGPENCGFVLPRDCTIVNPDCVGILRGAPHRAAAERFIEYLLSEPGQQLLMVPRGHPAGARRYSIERMSIRPALYGDLRGLTLVAINPFAVPMSFAYDAAKGGARWDVLNGLIGATIIDVHPELVAAARRGLQPPQLRPPVTEAEAQALAAGDWKRPALRQRQLLAWQRWAQEKFRRGGSGETQSGAGSPHSKTWRDRGMPPTVAAASWSAVRQHRFGRESEPDRMMVPIQ